MRVILKSRINKSIFTLVHYHCALNNPFGRNSERKGQQPTIDLLKWHAFNSVHRYLSVSCRFPVAQMPVRTYKYIRIDVLQSRTITSLSHGGREDGKVENEREHSGSGGD